MSHKRRKPPNTFQILFLSHLVLLLFCFFGGLGTFFYIFAPGVRMYLLHTPLVLVPVLLFLIGIAGLLALWTARWMTWPVERLSTILTSEQTECLLAADEQHGRLTETDDLWKSIRTYQTRQRSPFPRMKERALQLLDAQLLVVDIDLQCRILSLNAGAQKVTQRSQKEMYSRLFPGSLSADNRASTRFREFLASSMEGDFTILVRSDQQQVPVLWRAVKLQNAFGEESGYRMIGVPMRR